MVWDLDTTKKNAPWPTGFCYKAEAGKSILKE